MKLVVDLPPRCDLEPGTVFHTFGYPEPEIFGFLYVHPDGVATVGIFVPSWFHNPVRTVVPLSAALHAAPLFLALSGRRHAALLGRQVAAGIGPARRALPGRRRLCAHRRRLGQHQCADRLRRGRSLDHRHATGRSRARTAARGQAVHRENLERAYVARRRASWVEKEGRIAEKSRDGFQRGGDRLGGNGAGGIQQWMLVAGRQTSRENCEHLASLAEFYRGKISFPEMVALEKQCATEGTPLDDVLMNRCGWPEIAQDGSLLVSHQDVLLLGGKVQAPPGYADHVVFRDIEVCGPCGTKLCAEMCSAEAITRSLEGAPNFDREKVCVLRRVLLELPGDGERPTESAIHGRRRRTALGRKLG